VYCLLHEAATRHHPPAAGYGVALSWQDIQHLVLGDRRAHNAALAVAAYLRAHTRPGGELFSLRGGFAGPTFDCAVQLGESSTQCGEQLRELLLNEQIAAASRRDAHWKKVQKKQREAADLRGQISRQESQINTTVNLLAVERMYHTDWRGKSQYNENHGTLERKLATERLRLSSLQNKLQEALRPPPALIQPLPSEQSAALQWLFFLHMDTVAPHLRVLSRISFLAQQALMLPCDDSTKGHLKVCVRASVCIQGIQTW